MNRGKTTEAALSMIVETPKGSRNFYRLTEDGPMLESVLPAGMAFPFESGYMEINGIRHPTMAVLENGTHPGCIVPVRPVGVLEYLLNGVRSYRLLAVSVADRRFRTVKDLIHLNENLLEDMVHFVEVFHMLNGVATEILGWKNSSAAERIVDESKEGYASIN